MKGKRHNLSDGPGANTRAKAQWGLRITVETDREWWSGPTRILKKIGRSWSLRIYFCFSLVFKQYQFQTE